MQRTRSVMIVWKEIKEEKEVDNKEKIANLEKENVGRKRRRKRELSNPYKLFEKLFMKDKINR